MAYHTKLLPSKIKYNKLKVIKFHHYDDRWRRFYLCKCECGNYTIVQETLLKNSNTKSCGCLKIENNKKLKEKRISKHHTEITAIILGYKRHAKDRGFSWELSREFVEKIINENCFYCGSIPFNKKKTKNSIGDGFYYNGIDRINSEGNYTENNVVPACKICNYAKSNMTLVKFKKWAIKIGQKAMADQWG